MTTKQRRGKPAKHAGDRPAASSGVYAAETTTAVRATLGLLKHFRAFIASDYDTMRDPTDLPGWPVFARRVIDKRQAQRKLWWLIEVAISRRAGTPDYPLNHLGRACRRAQDDYQHRLRRDQDALRKIARRIIVRQFETEEVRRRFGHRLTTRDDE